MKPIAFAIAASAIVVSESAILISGAKRTNEDTQQCGALIAWGLCMIGVIFS